MTQLFSRNKSEGGGIQTRGISWETFCSYCVILGSGQVTLPTSKDKREFITEGLRGLDSEHKLITWETHCPLWVIRVG